MLSNHKTQRLAVSIVVRQRALSRSSKLTAMDTGSTNQETCCWNSHHALSETGASSMTCVFMKYLGRDGSSTCTPIKPWQVTLFPLLAQRIPYASLVTQSSSHRAQLHVRPLLVQASTLVVAERTQSPSEPMGPGQPNDTNTAHAGTTNRSHRGQP